MLSSDIRNCILIFSLPAAFFMLRILHPGCMRIQLSRNATLLIIKEYLFVEFRSVFFYLKY